MSQCFLSVGAHVVGSGFKQFEMARHFATENGYITARRLLKIMPGNEGSLLLRTRRLSMLSN